MRINLIVWMIALGLSAPAVAQQEEPLSLQQAVAIALERNPQHKAALAETRAAKADVKDAQSFFFPRITFSEAATRSNDPVYVFLEPGSVNQDSPPPTLPSTSSTIRSRLEISQPAWERNGTCLTPSQPSSTRAGPRN